MLESQVDSETSEIASSFDFDSFRPDSEAPQWTGDEPAPEIPGFSGPDQLDLFDGSPLASGMVSESCNEFLPETSDFEHWDDVQETSNFDHWNVVGRDGELYVDADTSDGFSMVAGTADGFDPSAAGSECEQFEPVVTESRHQAMFARDLLTNCSPVASIVMPWEQGIFREIFSDSPVASVVPQMPLECEPLQQITSLEPQQVGQLVASATLYDVQTPMFMDVISSKDDVGYMDKLALVRERALSKLLVVVESCCDASSTGQHIMAMNCGNPSRSDAFGILDAVVGLRSPYTITKRANSLMSFLQWFSKSPEPGQSPFTEEVIWRYLSHLKDSGAPPTKGESFMSAARFARYVLGFDSLDTAINSRRLVGICELMAAGKRILKQAKVLQVSQVLKLHHLLRDPEAHVCDRAICAYMLLALYGRCRHSDLQMIKSVECDFNEQSGGFVIVQTTCHKTGRSAALKSTLLPIIIPARGVDGTVYAGLAINLLQQFGLEVGDSVNGPLLHAPLGVTNFLQRGLTSRESSMALRKLLGLPEPDPAEDVETVSSHSLKATCLSWSAKRGLSPSTRSMLGRHATVLGETFAIYSRGLMVAPAVELQKLIDEVAQGLFNPDGPRSSFFVTSSAPEAHVDQAVKVEPGEADLNAVEHVDEIIDVYDSGESSSDGGSAGQLSSDEEVPPDNIHRVKRYRAKIPQNEEWFSHKKSKILHKKDEDTTKFWDRGYLLCGKLLTDMYERCNESSAMNTLCRVCSRRS